MTEEIWVKHLRKLAKDNFDLRVIVRSLRLDVTRLQDDVDHYKREFVRQNAKLLELSIRMEVDNGYRNGNIVAPPMAEVPAGPKTESNRS